MKFYQPFWPYDSIHDFNPRNGKRDNSTSKYIWEVFDENPFDGILFSRSIIDKHNSIFKKIKEAGGFKEYYGFEGEVLSDCGAFSYADEPEPPYSPKEILEFYETVGADLGVTIDHVVFKPDMEDKEKRIKITLENAKKMREIWEKGGYSFDLIGIAQGGTVEEYIKSIKELIRYGYEYIALGGMVQAHTSQIEKLLKRISNLEIIQEKGIRFHLFGTMRKKILKEKIQENGKEISLLEKANVISFDTDSPLKNAWMSSKYNYYYKDKRYPAIRIRIANRNDKLDKELEEELLKIINKEELESDELLPLLKKYDPEKTKKRIKGYEEVLKKRLWEKCECPICKNFGQQVVIFRRNERNMRRGFHNVYQFYKNLVP